MKTEDFRIEGMTCGHCVMSVRKELTALQGLTVEKVEIGSATVRYDETRVGRDQIVRAIGEAGYAVSGR